MFWTLQRWFNGSWAVDWWLLVILMSVNILAALNFTRVFRLVFIGKPQSKTRRTPEVPWPMAFPMVSLTITTLLAPLAPIRWDLWLSPTAPLDNGGELMVHWAMPLLTVSGILGCLLGAKFELRRSWARPTQFYLRFFQDLFAYDFYLAQVYDKTIVFAVASLSKLTSWLDRYVVDGAVNLVSLATIFSGNALRYNVSGQSQFYILTIVFGVGLLIWFVLHGDFSIITDYWSSLKF